MSADTGGVTPERYAPPGSMTELSPDQRALLAALDPDPVMLCKAAQGLLVLPGGATSAGLSPRREAERGTRPARELLRHALERDNSPLGVPRELKDRVTGTCRHFAVLSCAFLRAKAIPSRARCGFATYFEPGLAVDHWITEYWARPERRWVRVDSEILGLNLVPHPENLERAQFLAGPEAWRRYREGADAMTFGVHGTDHAWGVAEIIGNAIRDLACLNRVEMLPWDEWGPMAACYRGDISTQVEEWMDELAAAGSEDEEALEELYEQMPVPTTLIV